MYIYIYIYIYIYTYIRYKIKNIYILTLVLDIQSLYIYIVIVCNHEITHTSYTICRNKFLAFLHQQKFTKLYRTFNCNVWSNAWILYKKDKRAKRLNKINSRS